MNNTKRNPCEEFSNKMWLYVDKSLEEKEMNCWDDHLKVVKPARNF